LRDHVGAGAFAACDTIINNELRASIAAETDVLMFQELQSTGVANQSASGTSAANAWSDVSCLISCLRLLGCRTAGSLRLQ
jgi:hypothetical protein